ncbi:MAG: hypothetical protein K2X47_11155, partial [Bdellovibrionales bacterium]|nr:hypothetical protein [Bdellovibrionales bacterium]
HFSSGFKERESEVKYSNFLNMGTKALFTIALLPALGLSFAFATTVKIGNGDDGSDLEGFDKVTSGKFIEARDKAVKKLKDLNVPAVRGLGALIPELERSPIYISKKEVGIKLEEDQARFHSDLSGNVYARTFAEPHAPTRIFPAADGLSSDQLVSLLIHEALHRALNEDVREDEEVVSAMTMAIAGPDSSKDRIQRAASRYLDEEEEEETASDRGQRVRAGVIRSELVPMRKDAQIRRTANLEYSYQRFSKNENDRYFEIKGMHLLKSEMLAFGSSTNPFGLGVQLGFIEWQDRSRLGPVGVSGNLKLWTTRGFDFFGTIRGSFNSLGASELKNSSFGRDVYSFGLAMRRDTDTFYIENALTYSMKSEVVQKIEAMTYNHEYGGQGQFNIRGGAKVGPLRLGGFANVILSDYYRIVEGPVGGVVADSGRFHIMSAGPELAYQSENFHIAIYGRAILSGTDSTDYSYTGNLLGEGAGNGMVGMTMGVSL